MNRDAEIVERMGRVEELRRQRRAIRAQVKSLNTDRKLIELTLETLLDEVKEIREGGGVQTTLTAKERDTVEGLDRKLKKHGATMTIRASDGTSATIGATGAAKPKAKKR